MSYGKIGLTTVAVTQDLLSGMPLVLLKRTHPPLEQYITWTRTTQCPTVQTNTTHSMQEDQAYSKPVVYNSLYPMISRLLRQEKGKHYVNSNPPQATGELISSLSIHQRTILKHFENKCKIGTFEKHFRSVSRAASQRLGILRKSWRVFHDKLLIGRCFGGFVLPVFKYCSAVWCSAADTHLKLLHRVVSGACFLAGGVLNCDLSHRRSVAVLCILYKIR